MTASPDEWGKIREEASDKLRNALTRTNQPHRVEDIESVLFSNCKKSVEKYKEAVNHFLEAPILKKVSGKSKSIAALQSLTDNLHKSMSSHTGTTRISNGLSVNSNQASSEVRHQQAPNIQDRFPDVAGPAPTATHWQHSLSTDMVHHSIYHHSQAPRQTTNALSASDSAFARPGIIPEERQQFLSNQSSPALESVAMQPNSATERYVGSIAPAAQSLLMLQNPVDISTVPSISPDSATTSTQLSLRGPPVQSLKLSRVGKNLIATWSPPDLASLPLIDDTVRTLLQAITYHVVVHAPKDLQLPSDSTKQCCYLISPEDSIEHYRVEVTWSIPGSNIFESIQEATSNSKSLYVDVAPVGVYDVYIDDTSRIGKSSYVGLYEGAAFQKCVVKRLERKKRKKEWDQLKSLQHSNIACYYAVAFKQMEESLVVAVELCQSLTLDKLIACDEDRLPPPDCRTATLQILLGLKYLHDHGIVHGDLRPKNIFFSLSGRNIKLAYFGINDKIVKRYVSNGKFSQGTDVDIHFAERVVRYIFTDSPFRVYAADCDCSFEEDLFEVKSSLENQPYCFKFAKDLFYGNNLSVALSNPFYWSEERLEQYLKLLTKLKNCKLWDGKNDTISNIENTLSNEESLIGSMLFDPVDITIIHTKVHRGWNVITEDSTLDCEIIKNLSDYLQPAPYQCLSGVFRSNSRKRQHTSSSDEESV